MTLFSSKVVTSYPYGDSIHKHSYAGFFVLQKGVWTSTEFLSLVLKLLIVHSCGALCTTAVHDFYFYASGAAGSSRSPSSMAVRRRCFLSVGVLWCRPVLRPVPVVIWHRRMYTRISRDVFAKCHCCCYEPRVTGVVVGGASCVLVIVDSHTLYNCFGNHVLSMTAIKV